MSEPNQPVQNYEVVSPAIETLLRTSLPSVAGYGGLVRATNTIVPVLDVSAAAEGSSLPTDLSRALAFGSQTAFQVDNTDTTIANVPGFYRVVGSVNLFNNVSSDQSGGFKPTDGSTTKVVWACVDDGNATMTTTPFDLILFLASGESLQAFSTRVSITTAGSVRQVATSDGTLVNPSGFPL